MRHPFLLFFVRFSVPAGTPACRPLPVLDEANVGRVLAEALAAQVQAVLADQTLAVGALAAAKRRAFRSRREERGLG